MDTMDSNSSTCHVESITDHGAMLGPSKPTIIGLYGISGTGKSYLLNRLSAYLPVDEYTLYDGSAMIDEVTTGGLEAFKAMDKEHQGQHRELAIEKIRSECAETNPPKTGIVGGHFSLLNGTDTHTQPMIDDLEVVCTPKDLEVYTHILYLDNNSSLISAPRKSDTTKERCYLSMQTIDLWQQNEISHLRQLCQQNGILFTMIGKNPFEQCLKLVHDIKVNTEEQNARQVAHAAELGNPPDLKTILVFDADKTIAPFDSGKIFFEYLVGYDNSKNSDTIRAVFTGESAYRYHNFRQAMFLYEEIRDDTFDEICKLVALKVVLYPEIYNLIKYCTQNPFMRVVIITSGIRQVWERVLFKQGLSDVVDLVGGSRLSDGYVVTPDNKAQVVKKFMDQGHFVYAFGDSPIDIPMLTVAHEAIVVVGDPNIRSKSMDQELNSMIAMKRMAPRQVLLPANVPRRPLSNDEVVDITKQDFVDELQGSLDLETPVNTFQLINATGTPASKLLSSSARDSAFSGPSLRAAHQRIGHFLALNYISTLTGLETRLAFHVNDTVMDTYRFLHESQTTIVALMRAGEPLAMGINEAMPKAMFVHAKQAADVTAAHINGQTTVILVDFVINSGETILEFMKHVRRMHATIRIIVVAGVVQKDFVDYGVLEKWQNTTLVTLRTSSNNYKGKGKTDTGHRLFNTTHMD